jgi:hypothetical protein
MKKLVKFKSPILDNDFSKDNVESWVPESSGGGGRSSQPRQMRVDIPSFDGENPSNWVSKAIQYLDYYQIPENRKIKVASFYLEGVPLIWFHNGEDSGLFPDWDAFVRELHTRFEPEKEQELREQKGSAVEKLEEVSGEEIQEARNQPIKNKDVASGTAVESIEIEIQEQKDQSLFEEDKQRKKGDQQHQEIKKDDLLGQGFGKLFPDREEQNCDAENVYAKQLRSNRESIFFLWCGRWNFDPGIWKRLSTSIPPSTQSLKMRKKDLVCGLSGNGSGSKEEIDSMGFGGVGLGVILAKGKKKKLRIDFHFSLTYTGEDGEGNEFLSSLFGRRLAKKGICGDDRKNFVVFKHRWRWKITTRISPEAQEGRRNGTAKQEQSNKLIEKKMALGRQVIGNSVIAVNLVKVSKLVAD